MSCKNLFKVLVDGFELYIVADDEKEVKNHCFSLFDYTIINIKHLHRLVSTEDYPYFVTKEELTLE